jgi:hypothetical protein
MKTKTIIAVGLAALATAAAVAPADARDGCGRGYHRGPYGHCRPNNDRGTRVVVTPGGALVVGNYYHGRGYWDGRRYWQHRRHWHNNWRYY